MRIRSYYSLPSHDMCKGDGDLCPTVSALPPGLHPTGNGWLSRYNHSVRGLQLLASRILLFQPLPQFLRTRSLALDPFPLKIHSAFFFSAINPNCYTCTFFSKLSLKWKPCQKWGWKAISWVVIIYFVMHAFTTFFIHANIYQACTMCQAVGYCQITLTLKGTRVEAGVRERTGSITHVKLLLRLLCHVPGSKAPMTGWCAFISVSFTHPLSVI